MFGLSDKDENARAEQERASKGINFPELRSANQARQKQWDPGSYASNLEWRGNELFGEAGEAANVIKKIHRERCGVPGSRATMDQLAEELADVIICLDLYCMEAGVEFAENYNVEKSGVPLLKLGMVMAVHVGRLCHYASAPATALRADLLQTVDRLQRVVATIARNEGIDLWVAVAAKFNATTHKMNLYTFLRLEND